MSCEIACVGSNSLSEGFLSLRKGATVEVYAADDACVERLGGQVRRKLVDKGYRRLAHGPIDEASCEILKVVQVPIGVDIPVQEIYDGVSVFLLLSNTCGASIGMPS